MATWDIFRGGQDLWRRNEMGERYIETGMRLGRLQRDAFESVDKAWAARTVTSERIAALLRQVEADRKVIVAYGKEYELGQRSLIDLLNAQNQLFNGLVSLEVHPRGGNIRRLSAARGDGSAAALPQDDASNRCGAACQQNPMA